MEFDSFQSFLQMGKHGPYVWSSFGIALAVFLGLEWDNRRRLAGLVRRTKRQLKRQENESEA